MAPRRAEIERRRLHTFNELLVDKPWDKKNIEKGGASNSSMLIFHDSWLPLLEENPIAKKAYEESTYQKGLEKFINEKLSQYVYKRQKDEKEVVGEEV